MNLPADKDNTTNEQAMRKRFDEEITKLKTTKGQNSVIMDQEQYKLILESVKHAKVTARKTPLDYRRLKRYDICCVDGRERLITPVSSTASDARGNASEPAFKIFVSSEEAFDIIHKTHLFNKHCGRHKMMQELNKEYKNITQELVCVYLTLCPECQKNWTGKKSKDNPLSGSNVAKRCEMNRSCRINLIDAKDLLSNADDMHFEYIFIYQDDGTKFIQLRQLKSRDELEIADAILDIFCMFGPPLILYSNIPNLNINILKERFNMWTGLQFCEDALNKEDNIIQDFEKYVDTWFGNNGSTSSDISLKFIQYTMNCTYNPEINSTPFKEVFGKDPNVWHQPQPKSNPEAETEVLEEPAIVKEEAIATEDTSLEPDLMFPHQEPAEESIKIKEEKIEFEESVANESLNNEKVLINYTPAALYNTYASLKRRRTSEDVIQNVTNADMWTKEYDDNDTSEVFGRYVGLELKKLSVERRAVAQAGIQNILTDAVLAQANSTGSAGDTNM